jgi:hypothetical protein
MEAPWIPDQPLGSRLATRVATLRTELAVGERRLAALDAERQQLRDTLLRISGALQVLDEELAPLTEELRPRLPAEAR